MMSTRPVPLSSRLVPAFLLLLASGTPVSPFAGQGEDAWVSLFDGTSLGKWNVTRFGGEGPVLVRDGRIILEFGDSLTGITWTGEVPRSNYELRLQAMRLEGGDFFCGLTFPVGDAYCTLIVGGWAGPVVGISSIDGRDASENETTRLMRFEDGRWYDIRLRVTDESIAVWIDGEQVIDLPTRNRRLWIRPEVDPSRPLGIASWRTTAVLRDIRLRLLQP